MTKPKPSPADRRELEVAPPRGLAAFTFRHGDNEVLVVSFPTLQLDEFEMLTECERAIVGLVAQGYSTRRIAAARGRSRHTVANQLGKIYRKLGVSSRMELVARLRS